MKLGLGLDVRKASAPAFKGLLDKFTGAAAAYSTRKLTASQPNILPADYGDGAAAAYSLRKVKASYSGNCIDVRRSSDNEIAPIGFSGNELDTTALTTFVNEDITQYNYSTATQMVADFASVKGANSVASIGGFESLKFTIDTSSGTHFPYRFNVFGGGGECSISFDYYLPSTNTDIDGIQMSDSNNNIGATQTTQDAWTSVTVSGTLAGESIYIFSKKGNAKSFTGNGTDVFYLKNIVVTQTTADGFVTKWYDQSGNENDATQETDNDQPQIVDAGSTILENGKPAIQFDGDDLLQKTSASVDIAEGASLFTVLSDYTSGAAFSANSGGSETNDEFLLWASSSTQKLRYGRTPSGGVSVSQISTQQIFTGIDDGSTSLSVFQNGTTTNSGTSTTVVSAVNLITIGARGAASLIYEGKIQEIILFDSDQSSNRQDIEWNINNHYNIYTDSWDKQSAMQVRRAIDNETTNIGFVGKDLDTTALETFATESSPVLDDYTGAAAAYSLRKVRSAYTGDAIRVRRSSDDTEQDIGFDSNGDLDSTALTEFVGQENRFKHSDPASGDFATLLNGSTSTNNWGLPSPSFTNKTILDRDLGNALAYPPFDLVETGETYTMSAYVKIVDGNSATFGSSSGQQGYFNLRGTAAGSPSDYTITNVTGDIYRISATIVAGSSSGSGFLRWSNANAGEIEITGFQIVEGSTLTDYVETNADISGFGYVTTWYDQTGNGNDATNSTESEQPLVVSGGTLVTENSKAAIEFDGADDSFTANALAGLSRLDLFFATQTTDTIYVHFSEVSSIVDRGFTANSGDSGSGLPANMGTPTMYNNGTQFTGTTRDNVHTAQNGHQVISYIDADTTAFATFEIGGHGSYTFNGKFQELIAFDSDQSANRTGIEGNIGRYYNIDGFRDVFVSKWYDQSGNFNHAENSTESEQPLVVSGGTLVEENGKAAIQFDGVDDMLQKDFDPDITQPLTLFHVRRYRSNGTFCAIGYDNSTGGGYADINVFSDFRSYYGSYLGTTTQNTDRGLWYSLGNGASSEVGLSGAAAETGNAGNASLEVLTIGSVSGAFDAPINTQEIIIFNSDQSSNREDIENNINKHFKIYEE